MAVAALAYVGATSLRLLKENGMRAAQILSGFWGDGRDAVLITSVASGPGGQFPDYERIFPQIGAGSLALTHIVFSDKSRYRIAGRP